MAFWDRFSTQTLFRGRIRKGLLVHDNTFRRPVVSKTPKPGRLQVQNPFGAHAWVLIVSIPLQYAAGDILLFFGGGKTDPWPDSKGYSTDVLKKENSFATGRGLSLMGRPHWNGPLPFAEPAPPLSALFRSERARKKMAKAPRA